MELKALLKNPNEWQFKNGYYEKAETEILETAFSKELQNDFNDAFADSWWERCNANVVISLFNKYRQTDRQTDRQ
ncbi:MAG: hypothetical protein LBQ37_04810, partial [Elusimicrobiota bacterium]|nr:hypothetical protein [Elusimicrobiota bacterium]